MAIGHTPASVAPQSVVPMAKLWTVTSTITREVPGHNASTVDYCPTTVANAVQSHAQALTSGQSVVDTSRTSVSKLRKPFEGVVRQELERNQLKSAGRPAKIPAVSAFEDESVSFVLTHTMDGSQDRPSVDALDESTSGAFPEDTPTVPSSSAFPRLKTPVWEKITGHSKTSTAGNLPRRSKKAQSATGKPSLKVNPTPSTKSNGPMDDDVSPTSSFGRETPRLVSPESLPAEPLSLPSETNTKLTTPIATDMAIPTTAVPPEPSSLDSPTRRKSKVEELMGIFDRKKQSATAQDCAEDQGVPVTCSIFPSPFRRESTTQPSPVKEKVSIFEGLVRPGPPSLPPSKADKNQENADPQPFLTGTELLEGKRKSLSWLTKPFKRMSIHHSKNTESFDIVHHDKKRDVGEASTDQEGKARDAKSGVVALNSQNPPGNGDQPQAQN